MDKTNTPALVGRVILMALLVAMAVAILFGCSMLKSGRSRTRLSTAIQLAYDNGVREAVSNRIESLCAEGKIDRDQAVRLHALAQLAYEGVLEGLEGKGGDGDSPASVGVRAPSPDPDAMSGGEERKPEPVDEGDQPAAPAPANASMQSRGAGAAHRVRPTQSAGRRNLRDRRRTRIVTRRVLYSA